MDTPFALIIEDNPDNAALFRQVLGLAGFRTEVVFHGQVAMQRLSNSQPSIVVLDLDLPGVPGNQILEMIRKDGRLKPSKVIGVTSYSQMAESLSVEPDLILFKPIGIEQFSDFIERFQLKIKYQTTIPMIGEPWDRVTDLYNQSFFMLRLESSLRQAREVDPYLFAVLTINIDQNNRMKNQLEIRDWIAALRGTAETLKTIARPTDTIARFDQDNFYILVENIRDETIPTLIAERIHKKLREKLLGLGNKVQFPIRVGSLLCDRRYENPDEILNDANTARSAANAQGAVFFECHERASAGD